jgi:hypothetical protein
VINRGGTVNNLVGNQGQERLLVGHMPIERARLHIKQTGEPAHRKIGKTKLVKDAQSSLDHIGTGVTAVLT